MSACLGAQSFVHFMISVVPGWPTTSQSDDGINAPALRVRKHVAMIWVSSICEEDGICN